MPHILNMAAVENMELGRASEIVTNIMSGFGLRANEVQRAVDVLAYTSTHANTDLNSLGETMKYAAPIAKSFGATLEETATMTKFMADAGITGSQAGTSLRQGLLRLVAPPKKASKAMQELGVTLSDAQAEWANANATAQAYGINLDATKGPGEQLISVIKQIESGMAGASDQEKIAALNAITGINAVSGWAAVMEKRIGKRPKGVTYPIWAWHTYNWKHKKPDLRTDWFRGRHGVHICIEIDVPDNAVLLNDEENWHFVLNDWYFSRAKSEEEYNHNEAKYGTLSEEEQRRTREKL